MPALRVHTSLPADVPALDTLPGALSPLVAEALGKAEDYVQVTIVPGALISFGGNTDAPSAFVALSSLELAKEKAKPLAKIICGELERVGHPPERVFIEFTDASRSMFGWNGDTFA
ncbi:MAG: phenylpyruvate tautomerase MIF-related protein [Verrucomicrobiota bacterium]